MALANRTRRRPVSRLLLKWIFTYVLILLIPAGVFSVFLFNHFIGGLSAQITATMHDALWQTVQQLDDQIVSARQMAMKLESDSHVSDLLYASAALNLRAYQTYKLVEELRRYRSLSAEVEDVYVLFDGVDAAVSGDACYTKEMATAQFRPPEVGSAAFLKQLEELDAPLLYAFRDAYGQRKLCYLHPTRGGAEPAGALVAVLLDLSKTMRRMEELSREYEGSIYFLDKENAVFLRYTGVSGLLEDETVCSLLTGEHIEGLREENGGALTVLRQFSDNGGVRCVAVLPDRTLYREVRLSKLLSLIVFLLTFLAAATALIYAVYSNYSPIRRLVEKHQPFREAGKANELAVLDQILSVTRSTDSQILERLQQCEPILQNGYLLKLLYGDFPEAGAAESLMTYFDFVLIGPFVVILLSAENGEGDSETPLRLLCGAVSRLCAGFGLSYSVSIGLGLTAVIVDAFNCENDPHRSVCRVCTEALRGSERQVAGTVTISVGSAVRALEQIPHSFSEARLCGDLKLVRGKGTVFSFEDDWFTGISDLGFTGFAARFSGSLEERDYRNACRLLRDVRKSLHDTPVSVQTAKLTLLAVHSAMQRAIRESIGISWEEKARMNEELSQCETLSEAFDNADRQLAALQRESASVSDAATRQSAAIRYADEHYMDPSLSLGMLSDSFGISAPNLSRAFKKETGYNFVEYLHIVRLAAAKEKLLESSSKIAEVAQTVGYVDSHSLIRAFKKFEGVTPGQYRDRRDRARSEAGRFL